MSFGEYLGAGAATTKLLLPMNGNYTDYSGNGVILSDSAGTITFPNYGKYNQSANFVGNTSLAVSSNILGSTGNIEFTYCINLYVTAGQTRGEFFFIGIHNAFNTAIMFSLRTKLGGNNAIFMDYAANAGFSTNSRVKYNEWNSVIITKLGDTIKVTLNGVTETFTKSGLNVTSGPFRISTYNGATAFFVGNIDMVVLENFAWTQDKVQKYYTNSLGRF